MKLQVVLFPVILFSKIIGIAPIKFNAVLRTYQTDHYVRWFSLIFLMMSTLYSTYFEIMLLVTQNLLNFKNPSNYLFIAKFIQNISNYLFYMSLIELVQKKTLPQMMNLLLDASNAFSLSFREGSVLMTVLIGSLISWKIFLISEYVAMYRSYISHVNNLSFFTILSTIMIADILNFGAVFLNLTLYLVCLIYFKKLHCQISKLGNNHRIFLKIDQWRRSHSNLFDAVDNLETISSKIQLTLMVQRYFIFNKCLHNILTNIAKYVFTRDANIAAVAPSVVYLLREAPLLILQFVFPVLLTNEVRPILSLPL